MASAGVCFGFCTSVHKPRQISLTRLPHPPPPPFTPSSCSGAETKQDSFSPLLMSNSRPRSVFAVKAAGPNQKTKSSSIVCTNCDGNGAIQCTQCKGNGVNSVDHFNGRFKAGALCWLCRGKRDILCGDCNGAGFMGGFLSTKDD